LTRVPAEMIAKIIFPYVSIDQIVEAKLYLEKIAEEIGKQMRWKCTECGKDIWCEVDLIKQTRTVKRIRRDARYCSQACRQRAFRKRKRVMGHISDTAAQPSLHDGYPPHASAES